MTELALAEQQVRMHDRLAELELRVDLLSKALADLTRPAAAVPGECPCTPSWQVTSTGGAL